MESQECNPTFLSELGTGMIEYALIIALILLVGVVGMSTLSKKGINSTISTTKTELEIASNL